MKLNDETATDLSSIILANKYTLRRICLHRMYRNGFLFCPPIYQEGISRTTRAVYRLKSEKLISSLLECGKIEELDLNQCYQISDLVSVLEKHSSIYSLHLANTQPSQTTLGAILTLTNLQKLDLGKGFIDFEIQWILNLPASYGPLKDK